MLSVFHPTISFAAPSKSTRRYYIMLNLKRQVNFSRGIQFSNCLNAGRIWASTPQIADDTDYADFNIFAIRNGSRFGEFHRGLNGSTIVSKWHTKKVDFDVIEKR